MIHINITELYNYWVRYQDKRTKEVYKDKNNRHSWSADRNLIEQEMEKTIQALNDSDLYEVLGFGINKRSFTQKPLVGVLTDNGKPAGKKEIMIGDKSLTKEFYDEFRGNKVRLILQVIQ